MITDLSVSQSGGLPTAIDDFGVAGDISESVNDRFDLCGCIRRQPIKWAILEKGRSRLRYMEPFIRPEDITLKPGSRYPWQNEGSTECPAEIKLGESMSI